MMSDDFIRSTGVGCERSCMTNSTMDFKLDSGSVSRCSVIRLCSRSRAQIDIDLKNKSKRYSKMVANQNQDLQTALALHIYLNARAPIHNPLSG